ncbi:MAG: lipoate--protein ligase family protein [Acidiferrobacteraceae bacterium]
MNRRTGRRIDLGVISPETYVATDRALLECREQGLSPDTLVFLEFGRPGALVGFHQSISQEIHVEYCRERGIPVQRRVTGGGALYVDDGVFGWELYLGRAALGRAELGDVAKLLCTLAAEGLCELGIPACYRPRNDIEVDGRKICGTGGIYDGDALLYHGSLLLDFDVERMLDVLQIPAQKWRDKAIAAARERVTSLSSLLGTRPGAKAVSDALARAFSRGLHIDFAPGVLSAAEQGRRERARLEIATDEWVYQHDRPETETPVLEGLYRCAGGLLRTALSLDARTGRIRQIWFTGDFFVYPKRLVADLEAALRDVPVADVRPAIERFFGQYPVEMLLLSREDFCRAVEDILAPVITGARAAVPGGGA